MKKCIIINSIGNYKNILIKQRKPEKRFFVFQIRVKNGCKKECLLF